MSDVIPMLDLQEETRRLRPELLEAIGRVLDSARFIMGPEVTTFESEFAQYLGIDRAIAVNSGTDALFIGLEAMGLEPGDEVITTPFTFVSTGSSILRAGGTPVFVDIDPETFNLDLDEVEKAIGPKTAGILPVHLFGRPVDMGRLQSIAQAAGAWVFEDVAQALSGHWNGEKLGAIGDGAAFSFFPSKNLGAYGDAGMLFLRDQERADRGAMLRVHGSKKKYHNEVLGYNSRLDAMQAAILGVKLRYLDEATAGRRAAAARYNSMLEGSAIQHPAADLHDAHAYHQYTVRVPPEHRDALRAKMTEAGISTMVYYPKVLTELPLFADHGRAVPNAKQAATSVMSLPIWPTIESSTQERVVGTLLESLQSLSQ